MRAEGWAGSLCCAWGSLAQLAGEFNWPLNSEPLGYRLITGLKLKTEIPGQIFQ
jgi:hypothetical protein